MILLMFLNVSFGSDYFIKSKAFSRCSFFNGKDSLQYHYGVDQHLGNGCEYAIEFNKKVIFKGKAFKEDCEELMLKNINKGHVCLTSNF